jgi:Tol biopolymer transport system component
MLATLVRTSGSPSRIATLQLGDEAVSRPLTPDTVRDDRWPAFSPDGASILFGRVFIDQANASAGIWTVQVRTGSVAQLSTDGTEPRWLP